MKKLITAIILSGALSISIAGNISAQQRSASDDIKIMAIIPTQADGLPAGAESALRNKMNQIAVANGLGTMNDYAQFCLLVNIDVGSKNIVGGAPVKHAQTLDFVFYIADQINETLFATTTVQAKGVGNNETKAYMQAISQLNSRAPELQAFLKTGKQKIIEYYTANCDKIIAQAHVMASMKQFGQAFFLVGQIPDACTDCYAKAMKASLVIFQQYVDDLCVRNLALAKSAWMAKQNSYGAAEAGQYLSEIYPDAACYGEAQSLYKEIKGKVLDDWKFEMKMWQDGVDLESQRIGAVRDIGVAWGQNQKPITYAPAFLGRY